LQDSRRSSNHSVPLRQYKHQRWVRHLLFPFVKGQLKFAKIYANFSVLDDLTPVTQNGTPSSFPVPDEFVTDNGLSFSLGMRKFTHGPKVDPTSTWFIFVKKHFFGISNCLMIKYLVLAIH